MDKAIMDQGHHSPPAVCLGYQQAMDRYQSRAQGLETTALNYPTLQIYSYEALGTGVPIQRK